MLHRPRRRRTVAARASHHVALWILALAAAACGGDGAGGAGGGPRAAAPTASAGRPAPAPPPRGLVPAAGQARVAAILAERLPPPGAPAAARPLPPSPPGARFVPVEGIASGGAAEGGLLAEDLDGDGAIDLLVAAAEPPGPLRFFRNRGDGTFDDGTASAGLDGLVGGRELVQCDYDDDGLPDVLVLRGGAAGGADPLPDSLLRNLGGGRFVDLWFESGLGSAPGQSLCAVFLDFDRDGRPDVLLGRARAPCALFRNRGDGTFIDVAAEAGLGDVTDVTSAVAADQDGDGAVDLLLAGPEGTPRLLRNRGDGTFADVTAATGLDTPASVAGATFADLDGDGHGDVILLPADSSAPARILLGMATRGFRADPPAGVAAAAGARWARCVDLDGDGRMELLLGGNANGPSLLARDGAGALVDATATAGLGATGGLRAAAAADLDGDGDPDLVVRRGDAGGIALLRNHGTAGTPLHPRDHAASRSDDGETAPPGVARTIVVRVEGRRSGRSAVGARVRVEFDDGGIRRQAYGRVGGDGVGGSAPLRLPFAVGDALRVRVIEVVWPATRAVQQFRNLPADAVVTLVEGVPEATSTPLRGPGVAAPRR